MKLIIGVLLLALSLAPKFLYANDGFAALGIGGVTIAKTDKIAIRSEVLDLSCDKIKVSYDFINESNKDEDALIMFPLPDYSASVPETYILAQGQPSDFTITVDGKPVEYDTKINALLIKYKWKNGQKIKINERDVTDELKDIGLSEKEIIHFPFNIKYVEGKNGSQGYYKLPISEAKIKKLTKAGLMEDRVPSWENRVKYVWNQRFPVNTIVHIEHSYRPFISEGSMAGFSENTKGNEYCLSKSQINKLKKLYKNEKNRDNYNEIPGVNVKYILTTANSWKDGDLPPENSATCN